LEAFLVALARYRSIVCILACDIVREGAMKDERSVASWDVDPIVERIVDDEVKKSVPCGFAFFNHWLVHLLLSVFCATVGLALSMPIVALLNQSPLPAIILGSIGFAIPTLYQLHRTTLSALRKRRQLRNDLLNDSDGLKEHVVSHLRNTLAQHRERMLGPNSEFAVLRTKLEAGLTQVRASSRYWSDRVADEEDDLALRKRLELAQSIESRFTGALTSLARQKQSFLQFFHHCESQLRKTERNASDYFEDQRLAALSRKADELEQVSAVVALNLATSFIRDATRLQQALQEVHSISVLGAAQQAGVEGLEAVAQTIVALERDNMKALAKLSSSVDAA
jgi:hypothetical protein